MRWVQLLPERFFARVEPDVVLQGLSRLEPLAALLALELGLQVDAGMLRQHGLAPKGLCADITGIPEEGENMN